MGWVTYLRNEGNQCNLSICSEFVASLLPISDESFSFMAHVRGVNVPFNLEVVGEIMGIPPLPNHRYEIPVWNLNNAPKNDALATYLAGQPRTWIGQTFNRANLAENLQTLWLVVSNTIDPTSHRQHLYRHHDLAMEAISHNKPFYLVRLVIKKIAIMYDSLAHNDMIKYGMLLTKVCLRARVRERDNVARKMQRTAMNKSTLTRAIGQLRNQPSSSTAPPGQ